MQISCIKIGFDKVINVLLLVLFTGVLFSAVVVGLLFDGGQEPVSRKIRAGLIVGGIAIALLGTVAGCGVAALLKIPFNVASGKFYSSLNNVILIGGFCLFK